MVKLSEEEERERITEENRTRSPFLRLPAEIRNKIYKHYFEATTIRICKIPEGLKSPGLLTVCRQVHSETTPLMFTHSTFDTTSHDYLCYAVEQIQKAQPDKSYVSRITTIIMVYSQLLCEGHEPEDVKYGFLAHQSTWCKPFPALRRVCVTSFHHSILDILLEGLHRVFLRYQFDNPELEVLFLDE
ncbi:hypothetical protein ACN47E_004721 [Coniothyrium glycines]